MTRQVHNWTNSLRWHRATRLLAASALLMATGILASKAWATSSSGLVAQVLALGVAEGGIGEHMQVNRNPDGSVTPWLLQLQALPATDYHLLRLVLSPGGHSGWHSHPGLLVGAVRSGQIDFFNANCEKRTVGAGEVYTENDAVHGIINNGSQDAELYITFLVKHGAPRRRDEPAPACALDTGIP